MKRRDILKYTALATGAAVGAPLLSSLLTGCQSGFGEGERTDELHFFSPAEFALVTVLVDAILPKTDSPAASEVGVDRTIDRMVGTVYPEADRKDYRAGFSVLTGYLEENDFTSLDKDAQLELLRQLGALPDIRQAFLDFKQQTVAYYLATEEVATNFLNYLPVPGSYDPCIELSAVEGGKAWAL